MLTLVNVSFADVGYYYCGPKSVDLKKNELKKIYVFVQGNCSKNKIQLFLKLYFLLDLRASDCSPFDVMQYYQCDIKPCHVSFKSNNPSLAARSTIFIPIQQCGQIEKNCLKLKYVAFFFLVIIKHCLGRFIKKKLILLL